MKTINHPDKATQPSKPKLDEVLTKRLRNWDMVRVQSSSGRIRKEMIVRSLPKLAFNLNETAAALSLSDRSVRRLVKAGLLRPSLASRRFIFSIFELQRFLRDTTND